MHAFFPRRGVIAFFTDVLFFVGVITVFLYVEYRFHFPEFRPYMGGCVFTGFFLVRKILLQSVALRKKLWYNKGEKRKKSVKTDRGMV